MNKFFHPCFLLAYAIFLQIPLFAQAPKLKFKHISIEQGLSNSTIETIFQDKKGFIWFGTRDGLNRYDGNQMVIYRHNAKDTNSISDNYIQSICEDQKQNFWVGTNNGLNYLNPSTNQFTHYKQNQYSANSISNNSITSIHQDRKGDLWIGTKGGGINLFLPTENGFAHFRHAQDRAKSLSSDNVNFLFEDAQANLWVATDNGLNLFNPDEQSFKRFPQLQTGRVTMGNNILTIQEDRTGNLLLGTEDNGLIVFNPKSGAFKQYSHNEKEPNSLASNQIRSIMVDKKQNIWIGGINGGLDFFNSDSSTFFHYQNEPDNLISLSQRTVSALYEDNQGNMWVGTHRGGVNLYSPNTDKFLLYRQQPFLNSLSYDDVRSFCEDENGDIWIATDGGGLNLFNPKANSWKHYQYNPFNPQSISSNAVLDITKDKEHNIWLATWGGGLCLFNRSSGTFSRFLNNANNPHSISSNYVQQVFEDSKNNLWVATYYGGLNLYDRKTKQFTRIVSSADNSSQLQGSNIVSINEDKTGNIWIGTDDGGLNCYETATKQFTHFFNKAEKMPDLRVIFIDSKNRVWVGQTGLYLFDAKKKQFSLFTDIAGLSTEFVKGIAEDEMNNFWIATLNGLTKFNPESKAFKKYNTADGLQGLEFEANAFYKTRSGEMFFGGTNGFNAFYPEDIKVNNFIPPIYITDFSLFNKKVVPGANNPLLANDISVSKEIDLSYNQSTFSFGFAALNYTALENNKYAYKLENWDKDWNYPDNERKASYINVSPGKYIFRVKGANNDGVWNEQGASLVINIAPPFWDTWWFRMLVALIVVTGLFYALMFRRKLELQKMNEEKRDEIHQAQLQFFTNISHEFRTPLTLILGPLEQLQKENPQPGFSHYYKVMHRNATRLMNLINELMDFRKSEHGMLKLNVMPGRLDLFLQEIAEEFSQLALHTKVEFLVVIPTGMDDIWFDRQVLEKIVINLIGNSFKYTSERAVITVDVLESLEHFKPSFKNELILKNGFPANRYIYVRVTDNGIGISKRSIENLFERYYKITDTHMGSGIGLAFVKSLTKLHKGDIYVYSEKGEGTEIIIAIPIDKNDYTPAEKWVRHNKDSSARIESIHAKYEYANPVVEEEMAELADADHTVNKAHILLVDDNDELRTFLRECLQPNYHIIEASNGFEGLALAKEEFPDLIISDVMMPKMDGIEFCKRIKEDIETSHIPFFMLTAKNALEARIEGTASGADFYFTKPLTIELLTLTIKNTLLQKQKLKERYFTDIHADAKDLVHSAKDKEFLNDLIVIIEAHLDNPEMDVDYICSQMGMSKTKLYQKIKKLSGQSIGEFIRTIRFKKAVQLMTHQDVSLIEVMYSVGIQTQSYFTKAFKKEFGKTPSQFLKDLQK